MASSNYANFGVRWVAHILDIIIIYLLTAFIVGPILTAIGFSVASSDMDLASMTEGDSIAVLMAFATAMFALGISYYVVRVLYGAFMESSKFQGTLGKMALGIKVTDTNGDRLSFVKALLRHIGKIISGMIIFIGYIMAAFTEKKQGLHDMIASSIVVKK